jgi:hypothetical protein
MWDPFRSITQRLARIETKQDQTMSAIGDLKPLLDEINTDVASIGTAVASVLAKLQALQSSTTTTLSPADQTTLDAAVAEASAIKTSLDNINTELNPAPPPPAPAT